VSELAYIFGQLMNVSRNMKEKGEPFVGLDVDDDEKIARSGVEDSDLKRSFTPGEIIKLIEDNYEVLSKEIKDSDLQDNITWLKEIQARVDVSKMERPLTLAEFDDQHQKEECVYGITRDSVEKRITLVMRGTSNQLAMASNWKHNFQCLSKDIKIPDSLKGKLDIDQFEFHTGFYDYLFMEAKGKGTTKYAEMLKDVKSILAIYPDHKLYVTGHSLGGALSTLAAFFFACETDIPKPVSCVNFAAPRVGKGNFLKAICCLEKTANIRMLRVNNDNDSVPTSFPGYQHVGFQVILYKKGWFGGVDDPDIAYAGNEDEDWFSRAVRGWNNGMISNINFNGYEHGGATYMERIELGKDSLQKHSLNELYFDEKIVGYKIQKELI